MIKIISVLAALLLGLSSSFAGQPTPITEKVLTVTEKGFEPNQLKIAPGTHLILKITRKTNTTCATDIKLSNSNKKILLPLNKEVTIDAGILAKGDIRFACGMNMLTGHIIVE